MLRQAELFARLAREQDARPFGQTVTPSWKFVDAMAPADELYYSEVR